MLLFLWKVPLNLVIFIYAQTISFTLEIFKIKHMIPETGQNTCKNTSFDMFDIDIFLVDLTNWRCFLTWNLDFLTWRILTIFFFNFQVWGEQRWLDFNHFPSFWRILRLQKVMKTCNFCTILKNFCTLIGNFSFQC